MAEGTGNEKWEDIDSLTDSCLENLGIAGKTEFRGPGFESCLCRLLGTLQKLLYIFEQSELICQ